VAVEKLLPTKFAKIKLRQESLQSIFSGLLDIFYLRIWAVLDEKRVFQQPQPVYNNYFRIARDSPVEAVIGRRVLANVINRKNRMVCANMQATAELDINPCEQESEETDNERVKESLDAAGLERICACISSRGRSGVHL
jgi:hypothetical protein